MIWVRVYGGRGRSKQSSAAPDFETCNAHTHTQTNEIVCLMNILENVVNICIINDLSYPPATHPQIIRMHFFITRPADYPQCRGYNHHPCITTVHSSNAL